MSEETKLKRLPEESDEARYFRECYGGNSMYGVHQALRIWTVTHAYPNGSQAKTMAAMTNVVAEAIEELNALRNKVAALEGSLAFCSSESAAWAGRAGAAEARIAKLEAEALDDYWPHGATVKLRWVGVGYCEKNGWAKRDAEGHLISVCSGIRLDDSSWEVIQERKEQPPKGEG